MKNNSRKLLIIIILLFVSIVGLIFCLLTTDTFRSNGNESNNYSVVKEDNFCENYYKGTVFDGFCFTDFDKTVLDNPRAENGVLKYIPEGSSVERIVNYPTSVKIINFGLNFHINIILKNQGTIAESLRFNDFKVFVYNLEDTGIDQQYIIQPGEIKNIDIIIDLPNIDARPGISRFIYFRDNLIQYSLQRMIFYWDYNPFSGEVLEVEKCGSRNYLKEQGVCYNNVFFPSIGEYSCYSDNDCLKYGDGMEKYKCYEYSCLDTGEYYNIGPRNKEYKVGILPLYITDKDEQYNIMEAAVNNHFVGIISNMENWFYNEKKYWNISNQFNFNYFKINNGCRMAYADFTAIHPNQGNMSESELRKIEAECIDNKNYDILIISIQRDDYWNSDFIGAGINHGTIMASALSPSTIIHELLHSFGEHDLYGFEPYQWGNCYLYNTNTIGEWDRIMPHLCKFEAMQLGWFPKYPPD